MGLSTKHYYEDCRHAAGNTCGNSSEKMWKSVIKSDNVDTISRMISFHGRATIKDWLPTETRNKKT